MEENEVKEHLSRESFKFKFKCLTEVTRCGILFKIKSHNLIFLFTYKR